MRFADWFATQQGLTQDAFAKQVGVTQGRIAQLLQGAAPSLQLSLRIKQATGDKVTPSDWQRPSGSERAAS